MQWFNEYYKYIIVFVALCIASLFVFVKAGKSYSSHQKEFKAMEKEMKRLAYLKQKYKDFNTELLSSCPEDEILHGVGTVYEAFLANKENGEEAFLSLSENIQNVYVLNVFVTDGGCKEFFSQSESLLKNRLIPALSMIGADEIANKLLPVAKMYDEEDETVSYSEAEIEKTDIYIKENDILSKIKVYSAEYIKTNIDILKI